MRHIRYRPKMYETEITFYMTNNYLAIVEYGRFHCLMSDRMY
jgi:hypothetical protein